MSRRGRRAFATYSAALIGMISASATYASPMGDALRAHDWPTAETTAAGSADPLARTLVTFLRMLTPQAASDTELAAWLAAHPDWPDTPSLDRRLDEAIAADPDDAAILPLCRTRSPNAAAALLRCADAARHARDTRTATATARRAWTLAIADPAAEAAFLRDWSAAITPDDDWQRFDRLDWAHDLTAERAATRLDPPHHAAALARLAFRRRDPAALTLLAGVPEALRGDPTLLLEEAASLRATDDDAAALALWHAIGATAAAAAAPARRPAFWLERDRLARRRLAAGDADGAFFLADDPQIAPENRADALFLAGWIALRHQHDPSRASLRFHALADNSQAALTQSRAFYWLGRAATAAGDRPTAEAEFARAAAWPNTFYGQLANLESGHPIIAPQPDPAWTPAQAIDFTGRDFVRAATILAAWGDRPHARLFLTSATAHTTDRGILALAAHLALGLGLPETAVQIARIAGRAGIVLPNAGWPAPYTPPAGCDRPLALGLIRQESSFDPQAASPAGARGLMQLMPQTARELAHAQNPSDETLNLADPDTNMTLGCAYLAALLTKFGGVIPYAVAAYNAGPRHVREWLATNGDPAHRIPADNIAALSPDLIDWIEQIPFAETRNYVQRVLENQAIYRARPP